jgi:uncharacterized protein involved in exopolysaccharide biosynthesis
MEMELVELLRVIWRWLWLIILIVAATCLILYFNPSANFVDYQAEVVLLLSTPDREDVSASDEYTFTNDRDEVTIAVNKFVEIAQYPEVRQRTMQELNIDESYGLVVDPEIGSDFVYIRVSADTPELAASIANTHAQNAIDYFGEIRALPSSQALVFFESEITVAEQKLRDTEAALSAFQLEHGIVDLESELELQYDILEQLEVSRAQLQVFDATDGLSSTMNSPTGQAPVVAPNVDTTSVDALIEAQRNVLSNLALLEPEYNRLRDDVEDAQDQYNLMASQLTTTETRESFASQAMFIQLIQAANPPSSPQDTTIRTISLGAVGSLGLAILLAFLLDYILKKW